MSEKAYEIANLKEKGRKMSKVVLKQEIFELSRQELKRFIFEVMNWCDEPLPSHTSLDQAMDQVIDEHLDPVERSGSDD